MLSEHWSGFTSTRGGFEGCPPVARGRAWRGSWCSPVEWETPMARTGTVSPMGCAGSLRAVWAGHDSAANATAARRMPPRDEDGPVGPQGEISMAVGPSLGNEVGGSSRDHLTGRCRRLLQRWRLRRCRVHRTRRDRVNEAAIAIERAGVCGELAAVSDRVCLYCGISKWLDAEALDPCKRNASRPVGGSKRADFQRVDQASLRGNMTLRRTMAHSPQGA